MTEKAKSSAKVPEKKKDNPIFQKQKTELPQSTGSNFDNDLYLQRSIGNLGMQRLFGARMMQTKLSINKPRDEYEQEADRISEQVMQAPELQFQRACGGAGSNCQTRLLDYEPEYLQTKRIQTGSSGETTAPLIVQEVLASPGQPLDPTTRSFIEPRLGYDFNHVRVHTGPKAVESVRTVNALAFTVGRDIVFGDSQYEPRTIKGRRLLTHELVHVVQQKPGTRLRTRWSPESASFNGIDVLHTTISLKPGFGISPTPSHTHDGAIRYVQRQAGPQSATETERSRQESVVEADAFNLCVAAGALGFIPAVTEAVVERTSRAMQAAIVHHVSTIREFQSVVEEYSSALLLASPADRERFLAHHRRNLVNFGISGQTIHDEVVGGAHIVIVGSPALLSKREFVLRHEWGHVGLFSLGVPVAQHHGIMQRFGYGFVDQMPHLGTRVRL